MSQGFVNDYLGFVMLAGVVGTFGFTRIAFALLWVPVVLAGLGS